MGRFENINDGLRWSLGSHGFAAHEKGFVSPSCPDHDYPYGYSIIDDTKLARTRPHIVGEPEIWPTAWNDEFHWHHSITSIKPRKDKAPIVKEGTNLRYGNQYYCDGRNVWSWWHSPFGDLPWLEFETAAQLRSTNHRYAPAHISKDNLGFVYLTEMPELSMPVPLHLYRNGKLYLTFPGLEGHALVAGMGQHAESGNYLVARCGYSSVDLYALRGTTARLIGQAFASDGAAAFPVKFDAAGTKFTTLGYFVDSTTGDTTLHWVEYAIDYDPESVGPVVATEFSLRRIRFTPYFQTRVDHADAENIYVGGYYDYGNPPSPPRGTVINGYTYTRTDSQDSLQTVTDAYEIPVAAYYDDADECRTATLHYSDSVATEYHWYDNAVNYQCVWDHIFDSPYQYLTEGYNEGNTLSGTSNQISETKTAWIDIGGTRFDLADYTSVYHWYFDDEIRDYNGNRYLSFTTFECYPGGNIGYSADIENTTSLQSVPFVSEDSYRFDGYYSQLRFLDARNGIASAVKTNIHIYKGKAFERQATMNGRYTQTLIRRNCSDQSTSNSNPTTDYAASYACTTDGAANDIAETSTGEFVIAVPGGSRKTVGVPSPLVSQSVEVSPLSESVSLQCVNVGGVVTCTGDAYSEFLRLSGTTMISIPPSWASFGSYLPNDHTNSTYTHHDATTSPVGAETIRSLFVNCWKGSGSLRSDATQDGSGAGIQSLLTGKPDTPWRYLFNEAGYFGTPDYSYYPGSVEARGGEFANTFDASIGWTPSAVPDPQSQYPIGFY